MLIIIRGVVCHSIRAHWHTVIQVSEGGDVHLYVLRGSLAVLTSKDDVCQLPSRHSSIRLSSFSHAHLLRSDTHTHTLSLSLSHTHRVVRVLWGPWVHGEGRARKVRLDRRARLAAWDLRRLFQKLVVSCWDYYYRD